MTPVQILRGTKSHLVPDRAWLERRSFGAVDDFGRPCSPRSAEATRFGLLAAMIRNGGRDEERIAAVDWLRQALGVRWLPQWEEAPERTQAEVLAAIDAAIALASAGGRP